MRIKKALVCTAVGLLVLLCYRCAQVIPLTGGARDTKPPALVSVTPADRSTNIPPHKVTIVFKFDELISASGASQKLIINPLIPDVPEIEARGKILTVSFEKDLDPNTTYFLQFGNSVVDIHENNPYPNLSYLFSTGPTIDSANITGKLTHALTKKPMPDVSVMLYRNAADSAPLRTAPDYITRSDADGNYFLSAIKPGKYRVMAVADKNKNRLYDISETVGFLNDKIEITRDTVDLLMSTTESDRVFIKKKLQPFFGYNRYVLNDTFPEVYMITEKSIDDGNYRYETRNDTFEVYYKELYDRKFDMVFKSGKEPFDTVQINIPGKASVDSSLEKGTRKLSVRTGRTAYSTKKDPVVLNFSLPVRSLNVAKCVLKRDTTGEKPVFTQEEANEEGNLVTTFLPVYARRLTNTLVPSSNYTLTILPGAIETFWGTTNRDTLRSMFKTIGVDELGSLQVKLILPSEVKSYVLQVLNEKGNVVKEAISANKNTNTHFFYNLPAGDHTLRLVDDADQSKKFSPASYLKKRQAEDVYFYDKTIKIPAGWDVEAEWKLNLKEKK